MPHQATFRVLVSNLEDLSANPEPIYEQSFFVLINGPDCTAVSPVEDSALQVMTVTYGSTLQDNQALPTFTDAEGYLAAGLCSLGFTVVFEDASEDWLELSDNNDPQLIVLSQPDRKIDGEDLKG